MSHFPRWKIALVLVVAIAGLVFAAPSLLPRETTDRLPSWLQPVSLGLDLQGGSYLLLEVDTAYVTKEQVTSLIESIRTTLRKEHIKYADLGAMGRDAVRVRVLDPGERETVRQMIHKLDPEIAAESADDGTLTFRFSEFQTKRRIAQAVDQSLEIVRRRIDELGTREPSIQRQGLDRIVVQLPGVKDPDRIKQLLGKTAKLAFHMVDENTSPQDASRGRLPPGTELLPMADEGRGQQPPVVVFKRVEVSGDMLTDSQATFDQMGRPAVSFRFNTAGAKRFGETTRENTDKRLAIVLDEKVISAPKINEPILGGTGIITGNFSVQQAKDLALLLRAGALPAPLNVLEERTVGPDLGADSIRAGEMACGIGLVLVVGFMVVIYGTLGMLANVALVLNLVLLMAVLSLLGATLTLPGIAGIVLTMGAAVDANVLIYERMREEQRNGRSILSAVQVGFERAFNTIFDANVTHLLAAALLFQFGTGPIRGFAITLMVGIGSSMFTSIMVTRIMVLSWISLRRPKALPL